MTKPINRSFHFRAFLASAITAIFGVTLLVGAGSTPSVAWTKSLYVEGSAPTNGTIYFQTKRYHSAGTAALNNTRFPSCAYPLTVRMMTQPYASAAVLAAFGTSAQGGNDYFYRTGKTHIPASNFYLSAHLITSWCVRDRETWSGTLYY